MFYSPLRYPGGKNKLSAFIAKICKENHIHHHYIEPFAGGASVGLTLLLENFVEKITINDKDRSIYAFWYAVLNHTDEFCDLIQQAPITISEWKRQKEIQKNKMEVDLLSLGFSTLFLNRTNRSGILNAGVIGGIKQQGQYRMDCRFNKKSIIQRIQRIASIKHNITLLNMDAIDLLQKMHMSDNLSNTIWYFDPPYYLKADSLYMNYYQHKDHVLLSQSINNLKNLNWIVSYDNVPEINKLYSGYRKKEFSFKYMVINQRIGKEVLFFSHTLQEPNIKNWSPLNFKLISNKTNTDIIYKP